MRVYAPRVARLISCTCVQRLTSEKIVAALEASGGSMIATARRLRISRDSLYRRCAAEPALFEARDSILDAVIDDVEDNLTGRALAGEAWAIRFFLRTRARHRGYGA